MVLHRIAQEGKEVGGGWSGCCCCRCCFCGQDVGVGAAAECGANHHHHGGGEGTACRCHQGPPVAEEEERCAHHAVPANSEEDCAGEGRDGGDYESVGFRIDGS